MDSREQTLKEIGEKTATLSSKFAVTGIDGFVDKIMRAVDQRSGQGDSYTPLPTITAFADRIRAAAGKSTNIELAPVVEKLGGNGPIMANAQRALGTRVRYIGALGREAVHPIFADFAGNTEAVSLCDPGVTHAVEFNDGKIMLGTMASLDEITYDRIIAAMGEGAFLDMISRADLISMVNWTMVPNLTSVFNALLDKVFPNIGPRDNRAFFFDLTDPEKRSRGDVGNVLKTISRFQSYGAVTLGLNLKEAEQVDQLLGFSPLEPTADNLRAMADRIHGEMKIGAVVIHPADGAACATRDGSWYVKGPFCEEPKITTGAGDHFNAGFVTARLAGLSPESALTVAVATSGYYVRTARSPSINDLDTFIRSW